MKWFAVVLLSGAIVYLLYTVAVEKPTKESLRPHTSETPVSPSAATLGSRQYTVLLDVSTSRPRSMILQGQQFVDLIVEQMNYGDRLVLLPMYEAEVQDQEASLDMVVHTSEDMTSLETKERLDGARNGLRDAVDLFFKTELSKKVVHTDVLTTLSIASEKISTERHNCLILLSDMLQSSRDFEFEHLRRLPPTNWIDKRKEEGLVRPLFGSVVVVIGADPSTHDGVLVREFWRRYFEVSNASLSEANYRTTPPTNTYVCN